MCWTDDPVADFARHDAELQREIEKLPVCDDCGEHIQDDYYEINGETICRDCMDSNYRKSIEDYLLNEGE